MTRSLAGAITSAITNSNLTVCFLVDLDFSSGHIYYTNGGKAIVYGGNTYLAVGGLGGINTISETSNLESKGLSLTLSGIDPNHIAIALGENYQGRSAKIYFALLDSNHELVSAHLMFTGRMDVMSINLGETATISLSIEHQLIDAGRPKIRRFTYEEQKIRDATDEGLQYVVAIENLDINWGRTDPTGANVGGGGNPNVGGDTAGVMLR
jgi:hypothetical protein